MPTRSRRTPEPAPSPASSPSGIAVDAYGAPTVDPTKNVLDHVAAAIRRIDDLLDSHNNIVNAKLAHQSEVVSLRAAHNAEIGRLRAEHASELRLAESGRLDAIRQVDVLAVQTLAQSSKDTAAALGIMVDSTAKAIAAQTTASMATINDRLTILERSSYEGKGRGGGLQAGWGYLVAGVGLFGTILAIGSVIFALVVK